MNIIGIDYSMTCPAVSLLGNSFQESKIHFLTTMKKLQGTFGNITGHAHKEYKQSEQRYLNIANWVMEILPPSDCFIYIEDYSLGSKGQVFSIAENTGLLKHRLYANDIPFQLLSPSTIKKDFTSRGTSDKTAMYKAFVEKTEVDLFSQMHLALTAKVGSPISDIVDSYAISLLGKKHYDLVRNP